MGSFWPHGWGIYGLTLSSLIHLFFVVVFLIFQIFLSDFFLSSVLVVETPSDCSLFLPGMSLGSKKEFAQLQEGVLCETIWTCQVSCTHNLLFNSQNICM